MSEREPDGRHERDSVGAELDSMRQIARILDSLHDDDARQRVLRWAQDRYRGRAVPQATAATSAAVDRALDVDELGDLFDAAAPNAGAPAPAAKPAGVESMIKDFAADFRRFALEWQGA